MLIAKNAQFFLFAIILSSPYFLLKRVTVRGCIFSHSGNLPQVEFAQAAAHQSTSTVIATRNNDICIAVIYDPLQIESSDRLLDRMPQKIFRFDENICSIPSGVYADCRHLMNWLYDKLLVSRNSFGTSRMATVRLASLLGEYIHKRTLWPTRPFGTIVHIMGHDGVNGAKVIEVDPLGNCYDCRFTCVGPLAEKVFKSWNFQKDPVSLSVPDLLEEALLCLHRAVVADMGTEEVDCRIELLLVGEATAETIDISDAFNSLKLRTTQETSSSIVKEKIKNILALSSSTH